MIIVYSGSCVQIKRRYWHVAHRAYKLQIKLWSSIIVTGNIMRCTFRVIQYLL